MTEQRTPVCALLVFEACDVMDVTGPYEVFLTANRLAARAGRGEVLDLRVVSLTGAAVTAYGGLGLVPSHGSLAEQGPLEVIIVPGLIDLERALTDTSLIEQIHNAGNDASLVASVCTGAFLLKSAGLLGDVEATTHWEDVDALRDRRETGRTRDDVRWVDADDVVTSGGLSSGIAMALHLVERFADRQLAEQTATQIDYVWTRER